MPSVSAKQHRFMEAVAHNPEFARKVGVPQSVGQEFSAADKAKKARGIASAMASRRIKGAAGAGPGTGVGGGT